MAYLLVKLPEEVDFGRRKLKALTYISEGCFGKVYKCLMKDDKGRTRPFAVKHLDGDEGSSEAYILEKIDGIPFVCWLRATRRGFNGAVAVGAVLGDSTTVPEKTKPNKSAKFVAGTKGARFHG